MSTIDPADFMELSGRLPKNAVVDIEPVTVDIEGQRTLAALDIKIYANDKQKEQGKTWQPADKKVTVRWQDKAFASRTLDIYHLADGAEPERVASVEAKDGWVEFEADSFSVYAVTETILTQTITTSDGATYEIKVTYTGEAGLPMEGTTLQVAEIKADDKAFASYLKGWNTEADGSGDSWLTVITYDKEGHPIYSDENAFGGPIDNDTILSAQWEGAPNHYSIAFWQQKLDVSTTDKATDYDFITSESRACRRTKRSPLPRPTATIRPLGR